MRVLVSIGSNIEPARNLPRALALLRDGTRVLEVSRVYATAAIGAAGAPGFLNAAVLLETDLAPEELRERVLRPIESRLGRVRTNDRNAPRPIDLDIALFADLAVSDAERGLEIPNLDILRHAHVACPIAELAPDWRHPLDGRSLAEIATELGPAGRPLRLAGWQLAS